MGNGVRKCFACRVRPQSPDLQPFHANAWILEEVGRGKAGKHRRPKCSDLIGSIYILTALIGNLNSPYTKLSRGGLLVWILSMAVNFIYDGYESRAKYGYPWISVRGLLLITCCVCTWSTFRRTIPWLERGVGELERDRRYRNALHDMAVITKKLPYVLGVFAIVGGSAQYGMMLRDQATHVTFGKSADPQVTFIFHVLRFMSGVHVFYALVLFWSIPTCVMLMAGYSMIEYQGFSCKQLKLRENRLTLRQVIEGYNERVQFVKSSSSACVVILCMLIAFTFVSLAVNAYVFLFQNRSLFLYIVHALLPLGLAAYPLSTASWVTKQYHWHLVVVVKAWVECSESDSEDEQPLSITNEHGISRSPSDRNESQASETNLRIHMPDTGHVIVHSANDNIDRLQNVVTGSARLIGKLQYRKGNPKFNFEKYISYLDKVSRNVGFSIGVVLVTWELVSTLFFFLISLIALFVQESIFGKAKSTISI